MADENVQMCGEAKDNPYTRILAEKHELDSKIIKLNVFINHNPQFNALSSDMRIFAQTAVHGNVRVQQRSQSKNTFVGLI